MNTRHEYIVRRYCTNRQMKILEQHTIAISGRRFHADTRFNAPHTAQLHLFLGRHNDISRHGTPSSVQNICAILMRQPFHRSGAAMSDFLMYRMQMRANETCIVMTEWEFETLQFESFIWSCQRSNMRIITGGTAAQDVRADDSTKVRTESIDENLTG